MELLDIYDENGNHIGTADRSIVHRDALWHKTVHCWLYDTDGYIYFQRRKDEGTLYTTASGHIMAGESVEQGFAREIFEEIGYTLDYTKAVKLEEYKFVLDKVKKDGSLFRDRAMANIFVYEFDGDISHFKYDEHELDGLVKVKPSDALELFKAERGEISGFEIRFDEKVNKITPKQVKFEEFLVNKGETALSKYGNVLKGVLNLIKAKDK